MRVYSPRQIVAAAAAAVSSGAVFDETPRAPRHRATVRGNAMPQPGTGQALSHGVAS